jgi:hypothetical protein
MTRYVTVADTAKELRKALKEAFPTIKFSVRSKSYAGGASIRVIWQDGPTEAEAQKITDKFEGAKFDGMEDLKSYQYHEVNGERVSWGADYVFCERSFSVPFLQKTTAEVGKRYGMPPVRVLPTETGGTVDTNDFRRVGERGDYLWEEVLREARRTA